MEEKLTARDVALVEMRAKRLLVDRHYELSGYPLDPPGLREKIRLGWTNKTYKWQFACRRYGYLNFIMEKITEEICGRLHPMFVQRMNEISTQHLK